MDKWTDFPSNADIVEGNALGNQTRQVHLFFFNRAREVGASLPFDLEKGRQFNLFNVGCVSIEGGKCQGLPRGRPSGLGPHAQLVSELAFSMIPFRLAFHKKLISHHSCLLASSPRLLTSYLLSFLVTSCSLSVLASQAKSPQLTSHHSNDVSCDSRWLGLRRLTFRLGDVERSGALGTSGAVFFATLQSATVGQSNYWPSRQAVPLQKAQMASSKKEDEFMEKVKRLAFTVSQQIARLIGDA